MNSPGFLDTELNGILHARAIHFFGVADLVPNRQEIVSEWGDLMASFPRGISIGIPLPNPVVDQLPHRQEDNTVRFNYRHHAYTVINERLDLAASHMSSILQSVGFRVFPVPASQHVNMQKLYGVVSHKMVARLAGLGWIGKSCLLVTPEFGPRVRWATILTDAPLQAAPEIMEERCRKCRQCVDACPAGAFTGKNFHHGEPRSARYDAHRCNGYLDDLEAKQGIPAVCGMCLYICPFGRKGYK